MLKKLFIKIIKKYKTLLFVGSTDILPEPLTKEEEELMAQYTELKIYTFEELLKMALISCRCSQWASCLPIMLMRRE